MSISSLVWTLKHLPGKHVQQSHAPHAEGGESGTVVDPNSQALADMLKSPALEDFPKIKQFVKKHKLLTAMTPVAGKKRQYEKVVEGGKLHLTYEFDSIPQRIRNSSLASGTKMSANESLQFVPTGSTPAGFRAVPIIKLNESTSGYGNNSSLRQKFADSMAKLGFEHRM